jgi:hypothetical protein
MHYVVDINFANTEEVKDMVHTWIHTQPKPSFTDGIRKFMDQSNKCVEKLEDYTKTDSIFVLVCLLYNKESNKLTLLSVFPSYKCLEF